MKPNKILITLYIAILLHLFVYTIPNSHIGLIAPAWGQEDDIDDDLEDDIDDDTEDELEEDQEDQVEDDIDDNLEDEVEDDQEDQIEDDIDDNVEDEIEDDQEDQIEDDIDDNVEDEVEDDQEDQIEDDIDDNVEDELEDDIDDDLEDKIEGEVEDRIENDIEDDQDDEIDNDIEDDQDDEIDDDIEDDQDDEIDDDIEDDQDDEIEFDAEIDVIDRISSDLIIDDFGFSRVRGVWLIMTDKKTLQALEQFEFNIISSFDLEGLNKVLVEVVEPEDSDLSDVRSLLFSVLPDADVTIDYNHNYIYGPEISSNSSKNPSPDNNQQRQPHKLLPLPRLKTTSIKIGIIDSQVDQQHEALKNTTITAKSFVKGATKIPSEHGTAVASIIAGESSTYRGLLSNVDLYSASVFHQQASSGQNAMAISLILSLDWMARVGVDVINMSLAGPPNAIVKAALQKLHEQGVLIVAAAGNNGPVGNPLYPAAYDFVVAVTAVTHKNLAYAMANRGTHIDLAAPGVNIQHATTINTLYRNSSGTSLAAPFVTAKAAWVLASQKSSSNVSDTPQSILDYIYLTSMDLGEPGHDDVYGHGLIQLPKGIQP